MRQRALKIVQFLSRRFDAVDECLPRLQWALRSREDRQAAREYPEG
jgi:hypothetical protein